MASNRTERIARSTSVSPGGDHDSLPPRVCPAANRKLSIDATRRNRVAVMRFTSSIATRALFSTKRDFERRKRRAAWPLTQRVLHALDGAGEGFLELARERRIVDGQVQAGVERVSSKLEFHEEDRIGEAGNAHRDHLALDDHLDGRPQRAVLQLEIDGITRVRGAARRDEEAARG